MTAATAGNVANYTLSAGSITGIKTYDGSPGVVLTASTVIHDLVREREWVREVPEDAVVVPGARPAKGAFAESRGLQLATAVIVKYRDERTDLATALESWLR